MNARPELVGKTFGEIFYLFDNAIPCGMRKAGPDSQGDYTLINPPPETIFEASGDIPIQIRIIIFQQDSRDHPTLLVDSVNKLS